MEMHAHAMFHFTMCKAWNCIVIHVYIRNSAYYHLYLSINVFFYIWPHTLVVSPYFDHVVDPTMQFVFQLSVHLPPRRFTIPYG